MLLTRREILGSAAALGVLSACTTKGAGTKVKMAVPAYQDSLVILYGKQAGWFAEEGIDIDFVILEIDEIQEALAAGPNAGAHVVWSTIANTMVASARNANVRYIYPWNTFDEGFALSARPNGPLKPIDAFLTPGLPRVEAIKRTAAQLRGKTVITTSKTDIEQAVASAAARGGLDFKRDVKVINLPPNEGLAAFLSGEGDAYMGGIPQRDRAHEEGMIEVLAGHDLGPGPINGLVTSASYAKDNQDVLLKIMKVWFRIVSFGNKQTTELGNFVVGELNHRSAANFDLRDFKRAWQGLEKFVDSPQYAQRDIFSPTGKNYWRRNWDDCNRYFHDITGALPRDISPNGLFLAEQFHGQFLKEYGNGPY